MVIAIQAKCNGVVTPMEFPEKNFLVVIHEQSIKVEYPDALTIDPKATAKCMEEMSQKAWEHISTGPLFPHFFGLLFRDMPVALPKEIKTLLEDYDDGVIHSCGLIIMLCEAMFEARPKVFIKVPETNLHPAASSMLMTTINAIRRLGGDESTPLQEVGL